MPKAPTQHTYLCDCERFCKGEERDVSRATYHRHAPFRHSRRPGPSSLEREANLAAQMKAYFHGVDASLSEPGPSEPSRTVHSGTPDIEHNVLEGGPGENSSADIDVDHNRPPILAPGIVPEISPAGAEEYLMTGLELSREGFVGPEIGATSTSSSSAVPGHMDVGQDLSRMDAGADVDVDVDVEPLTAKPSSMTELEKSIALDIQATNLDMQSSANHDFSTAQPAAAPDDLDSGFEESVFDTEPDPGSQVFDAEPDPGSQAFDDENPISGSQEEEEDTDSRVSPEPDVDPNGDQDLDEGPRSIDLQELSDRACLDELKLALDFIQTIKSASLDDDCARLSSHTLERLREPLQETLDIDSDPDLRLALDLFLATSNSSQGTYTSVCQAISRRFPATDILSFDKVKRRVADLSGVDSIVHDMCINTCIAYTGPFSNLDTCPKCGESRFDPVRLAASNGKTRVPRQEFHTIPLGPQLQALWRDPNSAESIRYRGKLTKEILAEMDETGSTFPSSYDDIFHGSAYLEAVADGRIKDTDMVVMLSLDGAQLYQSKASDCWIYIWVVLDHSPENRYKKKYVLPGGFIPGPNKPKNVESFLFPGFHHVSALQKEGLPIWDASRNEVFSSRPFVLLGTSDVPGMVHLSGLVGHHGKYGCRLYCAQKGRHKPGASHYYPALSKPHNYNVEGCDHDDDTLRDAPPPCPELYAENLNRLISSLNETQYKKRRLETGISRPSIFLGFQEDCVLLIPICFGSDVMHLGALNIPDCLISLWRGTIDCDRSDQKATWDWAVLQGDVWKTHGSAVADATPYLPGSFDRPPRNPAEKISSGYKACEFNLYLYGLGPALFYNVLPDRYWRHFCKLVFGMRIVTQHHIRTEDLCRAQVALVEFCEEFEELYYQRRVDRLHFVRPCIHSVGHLASEVIRLGPLICSAQWTMERTIGNLGEEIRQPSNPFMNLSQRGLLRSQVNALTAMIPDLRPIEHRVPRGGIDLGGGYILLRAKERAAHPLRECEAAALRAYLQVSVAEYPTLSIHRWARLRLPNGQVARSAWKENLKPLQKLRMARNVKLEIRGEVYFAEVLFYMHISLTSQERSLALVSVYTRPDPNLLRASYNTVLSCKYQGDLALCVVDVKAISSVIAMVPFPGQDQIEQFFVVEKPGLDIAHLRGDNEVIGEENE